MSNRDDRYYNTRRARTPVADQSGVFFQTGQGGRTLLPPISSAFPISHFPDAMYSSPHSSQYSQPRAFPGRFDYNQSYNNQWQSNNAPIMKEASSHLHILPSLFLTLVAAIPNHILRYTALGLIFVLGVLCTVHLRSPSAQLRHLALWIDQSEDLIRRAMAQCPRIISALQKKWGDCSSEFQPASHYIRECSMRQLSKDIAACAKRVSSIRTAVLHIIEAEHQRKLAADIKETELILAAASTRAAAPVIPSVVASQYPPYRRSASDHAPKSKYYVYFHVVNMLSISKKKNEILILLGT
ncbi:hypothetical protein B0H13DRAFT_2278394 [Mycena leptocephala]|nr:hypothetical protein B0H13DRAFT_2278394 [Mycena leptocephala]